MTRVLLGAALVATLLTGCASHALVATADNRLSMVQPHELQRVRLPVTIAWKANDVKTTSDLTSAGPFFAVFVDRAPVAAGTGLHTLIDKDCRRRKGCPDLDWFAQRHIYVTGQKRLTLSSLPQTNTSSRTGTDHGHTVTVVLVRQDGVRVDESAASVEFTAVGT